MEEIVPTGRHTKFPDVDIDRLCSLLRSGYTVQSACNEVGISVRSFNHWRMLGQDPDEEESYHLFYFRTEQARYQSINHLHFSH